MARRHGKKRVTLKDVAEHAGVSLKTASNVKNNWPYVSDVTRARVKQAMQELGYRPSRVARSLVTGRTETVGVVVPDITNPFFSTIIRGCEDQLRHHRFSLFLCNTDESAEREEYYIKMLISQGVDGLLLCSLGNPSEALAKTIPEDVPVILVDGVAQNGLRNLTSINIENARGAEEATDHLLSSDRERIVFLVGKLDRQPARQRLEGFQRAMQRRSEPQNAGLTVAGMPTIGGGYQSAINAIERYQPDALLCYNDLMALGAMAAASALQVKVPDDLAIVGFDDIVPAVLVTPMLTTVRIRQYELGRYAVRLLMERIRDDSMPFKSESYPVELQVRESCGSRAFTAAERQSLFGDLMASAEVDLPDAEGPMVGDTFGIATN